MSAPILTSTLPPELNDWLVFSGKDQLDLLLEQYIHSLYDQFLNYQIKPGLPPVQFREINGSDWHRANLSRGLTAEELEALFTDWLLAVQQMSDLPLDQPQRP